MTSGRLCWLAFALLGCSVCSCSDAEAQQQVPSRRQPQAPQLNTAPRAATTRQAVQGQQQAPQQDPSALGQQGQPQAGFGAAAPPAPFELTQEQQAALDQALLTWEATSKNIQTLECKVHRWETDPVFGKNTQGVGELKFKSPDQGKYLINEINPQTGEVIGVAEHWVCDGKAIYEFDYKNKKQIVRQLPQELQGKAIADGPLPFLFGAEAKKLKARYWMRLIEPPPAHKGNKICLVAYPKHQRDAANFRRAEVMLDAKTWMPFALMLELPNGKSRTTHMFENPVVNSDLRAIVNVIFKDTNKPLGWQRVEEKPPADAGSPVAGPPATAPGQPPRTAQQPQQSAPPQRPR